MDFLARQVVIYTLSGCLLNFRHGEGQSKACVLNEARLFLSTGVLGKWPSDKDSGCVSACPLGDFQIILLSLTAIPSLLFSDPTGLCAPLLGSLAVLFFFFLFPNFWRGPGDELSAAIILRGKSRHLCSGQLQFKLAQVPFEDVEVATVTYEVEILFSSYNSEKV